MAQGKTAKKNEMKNRKVEAERKERAEREWQRVTAREAG